MTLLLVNYARVINLSEVFLISVYKRLRFSTLHQETVYITA